MIQIRDAPERVHSILKARAAREAMSLSDYPKRELEHAVEPPTYQCQQALAALDALPVERYAHGPLLKRTWELRHSFTGYVGAYIGSAEETDLYTCDEKLMQGHRARVRVFR
jgi:predicted nucleic acid-binding protein